MAGTLIKDPRPSLRTIGKNSSDRLNQSTFGDSTLEIEKPATKNSLDLKEEVFKGLAKCKTRSISMCAGDSAKQKLGWPLLRGANSGTSQTHHARDMSVVQWVMTLPDRSPSKSPWSSSSEDNPFERSISDIDDESSKFSSAPSVELPNGLEEMQRVNSIDCKWFSLELLQSCTRQFSSGWTTMACNSNCYDFFLVCK